MQYDGELEPAVCRQVVDDVRPATCCLDYPPQSPMPRGAGQPARHVRRPSSVVSRPFEASLFLRDQMVLAHHAFHAEPHDLMSLIEKIAVQAQTDTVPCDSEKPVRVCAR